MRKLSSQEFIARVINVHGMLYDYSDCEYVRSRDKVIINCKIHGCFGQTPSDHIQGCGCPICGDVKLSIDDFITKANIIHDNKYDYSISVYGGIHELVDVICQTHGVFKQSANNHLSGQGCPKCNESSGERRIRSFLEKVGIDYISQYRISECRYKRPLPFDFYIPSKEILIEYDGRQHFESIDYFGGDDAFKQVQFSDNIKTEYAKNNGIRLLRIKYTEYNNINKILTEEIK